MKKNIFIILFIFINTLMIANTNDLIFTTQELKYIQKNEVVKVSMLESFRPFSYVEDDTHKGLTKDILDLISKRSGLIFDIRPNNWVNNLKNFKELNTDIIADISYEKSREEFSLFSKAYYNMGVHLFKKKDNNYINSFQDLKAKKVGVYKGIFYKEQLLNLGIKVIEFETIDKLTKALEYGKIECFLSSFTNAMDSISRLNFTNISEAFEINEIKKEDLRFAVNKKKIILNSILKKTLNSISLDKFKELKKKWIIDLARLEYKEINITQIEREWIKNNKIIRVHNEKGWIPFNFYDKEPLGYSIDYMNLLAKKIGLEIKYITGPSWNNFLKMMKNNKLDVMLNIVKTKQRSKYLNFTDPYKVSKDRIYAKSETNISSLSDLSGKTVAIERGFSVEEHLKKHYPNIKLKYFSSIEHRLKAVSFGQVDATIATPEVAQEMIRRHIISNVIAKSEMDFKNKNLNSLKLRIATSKNDLILFNLIKKAMKKVSYEEKYKLDKKWFYSDLNKIEQKITPEEKEYIKNNKFKIATTNSWAPFNFSNKNHNIVGIGIDYLNLIANKLDLKFELSEKKTFLNVLDSIEKGNTDITFSTTNTKEREKYAVFSNPYEKFPIAIASTNEKNFIPNGSLLEGKKVAVGKEYSAYHLLKDKYPNINFVFTKDTKAALELVYNKEVYAAVDVLPALQFNINKNYENRVKISGTTGIFFEIKLMINKKHKHLLSSINKAIDSINNDEKNEIYRKWLLSPRKGIDPNLFYNIVVFSFGSFVLLILWSLYILKSKKITEKEKTKLNDILKAIPAPILISNIKTKKIVFANKYAELEYGISLDNLIGENIDIISIDNNDILELLKTNNSLINYETNCKLKNGDTMHSLLSIEPLKYNNQDCILGVISNITKLKDTENELKELNITLEDRIKNEVSKNEEQQLVMFQQSRHAQMGEMISMIAHQWRQPINTLSLILQNILFKYKRNKIDEEKLTALVEKGNNQIINMSETIDDFRYFFKPDKKSKDFSLNDELNKVLGILDPILKEHNIKVKEKFYYEVILLGYKNEFSQAIVNIINNAKDALVEKNIKNKRIDIELMQTNTQIILNIKDNAGGIPEDIIQNIFTPYFSTKPSKIGSGLGLHMSKMIIEDHMNGLIDVKNNKDGAEFIISFNR